MQFLAIVAGLAGIAFSVIATILDRRNPQLRYPFVFRWWALAAYIGALALLGALALHFVATPGATGDPILSEPWLGTPPAPGESATGTLIVVGGLIVGGFYGARRRKASLAVIPSLLAVAAVGAATTIGMTTDTTFAGLSMPSTVVIAALCLATVVAMFFRRATRVWQVAGLTLSACTVAILTYPAAEGAPATWPGLVALAALALCLGLAVLLMLRPDGGDTRILTWYTTLLVLAALAAVVALAAHAKGTGAMYDLAVGFGLVMVGFLVVTLLPPLFKLLGLAAAVASIGGIGPDELDQQVADGMGYDKQRQREYEANDRSRRSQIARYEADRAARISRDSSEPRWRRTNAASDARMWESRYRRNS